ncbi:MAG: Asp-tRNA(Asn)/Glu-tRNA(Gln) amidotransferase subunit GatC [Ferrimicrobium sp.]|uniref:Asp-tRNA(Asn)/Glu-tRNA(Gln) amidotransferase subunit GatC n=1 Tax=Ferrimicrobium sp. TaxID=2926050 RepID=UPI002630A69E|nr:Asp-tRNA(Asn)/Glu-tRNA(Gln) amidotransferase subunit GatC [Ferrimicrobium sp.]
MTKRIDQADVAHIAQLARLSLSDEELREYEDTLSRILDVIEVMNAEDLSAYPPMDHPLETVNLLRDDVVQPGIDREVVLGMAPSAEEDYFRVPRILGA